MSVDGGKAETLSWLLKVHTPFWPEAFLYIGRAIDLARVGHALHQFVLAAACVCFRRCRLCCRRQARRDDLLWLTEPAHPADACAALLDSDEAAVRAAANAVNGTPSSRGRTDQHRRDYQQVGRYDGRYNYALQAHSCCPSRICRWNTSELLGPLPRKLTMFFIEVMRTRRLHCEMSAFGP